MSNLLLIAPEIFLSIMALFILVGETIFLKKNRFWIYLSIVSSFIVSLYYVSFFIQKGFPLLSSFGVNPTDVKGMWVQYAPLHDMLQIDSLAVFFKLTVMLANIYILWFSLDYPEYEGLPMGTYSSLLLLGTVGMLFLVSSIDLLMATISIELLSISSFILVGFILNRRSSTEGAIKYFLVGSFSTALFLFGISYYYGYFGTTSLTPLLGFHLSGQSVDITLTLILIFLLAGLGFKLAIVPFHMWAPDTYEGAPTPITAFLSVGPKAAAIGFIIRLFSNHVALKFTPVLAVIAALTMTVGNIGALQQTNVKRLMAYSSIAQVGYILVALVAGESMGSQAAMLYTFVYLFMNLGIFTILLIISNSSHSDDVSTFSGVYKKSFGLGFVLILFLLSMTGIPPLAGFIGKFSIFAALIQHPDLLWLAVVAVLNSVISLYYYFRLAHQAFFRESDSHPLAFSPALTSCLVISSIVTLIGGIFPDQLIGWVCNLIGS